MSINQKEPIEILDLGLTDYGTTLEYQRELFRQMVEKRKDNLPTEKEYLILTQHNPVITLGKHANPGNIILDNEILSAKGIDIYKIERGGDVTFHAPGQLVAYPLLDLAHHRLSVKSYVNLIEESVIKTIEFFGIKGERKDGASGVWIDVGDPDERKICALGIKCSRFCTMHGLALNVNNNLEGFGYINPCGFKDKGVTSMENELGTKVKFEDVKNKFLHIFLGLVFSF